MKRISNATCCCKARGPCPPSSTEWGPATWQVELPEGTSTPPHCENCDEFDDVPFIVGNYQWDDVSGFCYWSDTFDGPCPQDETQDHPGEILVVVRYREIGVWPNHQYQLEVAALMYGDHAIAQFIWKNTYDEKVDLQALDAEDIFAFQRFHAACNFTDPAVLTAL